MPSNPYDLPLDSRELDALRGAAAGDTTVQIARRLCISERSVANAVHAAIRKLGARNRTHAVARAYELGLLGQAGEEAERG